MSLTFWILLVMLIIFIILVVLVKNFCVIEVEPGSFVAIERFDKFHRIVKEGKHIYIPIIEYTRPSTKLSQKIENSISTSGEIARPAKTLDWVDVGFSIKIDADITDPEAYSRSSNHVMFCSLLVDVEDFSRDEIAKYKYKELIEIYSEFQETGFEITSQVVPHLREESLIGLQIHSVRLYPHVYNTAYEYWNRFVAHALKNEIFSSKFDKPEVDLLETLSLSSNQEKCGIELIRHFENKKIEIFVNLSNDEFITLFEYKQEVEKQIDWLIEWDTHGHSGMSINRAADFYKKENWDEHFEWIEKTTITIKNLFDNLSYSL